MQQLSQQQQQQQSTTRLFQERSVQEEIQVAYEAFIRSVPRRPTSAPFQWQAPAHRCEDTCDFFQYRNVNICKTTANWHYCTEQTCDRLIRTHERQVCSLSGMAYDLELDTGADLCYYQRASGGGGGGGADDEVMASHTSAAHPEADDYGDDTQMRFSSVEEEEATDRRAPTPPRVESSAAAQDDQQEENKAYDFNENEHHARIALFESMLARIFVAHVHTHRSLFRSIAVNAERTWLLMQGSATLTQKKRRYQPEYHLLAIVYNMCHGYNCMKHKVVPFNRWVKENIPQVRHLKRLSLSTGEIKVKNFTQTSKLFRVCMTELLRHQGSRSEVIQRLQWIT